MTPGQVDHRPGSDEPEVVLVVDDDLAYRQLIRWALEDEGLVVETAADAGEALRAAERRPPTVAIVDVALSDEGGLDGIALAAELRRLYDERFRIITITADGRAEQKARQMRAGAWLQKPFDVGDLVGAVQRLLSGDGA